MFLFSNVLSVLFKENWVQNNTLLNKPSLFRLLAGCSDGKYGPGCLQICECHNNATCDHVTGVCECKPGWRGRQCSKGGVFVTTCIYLKGSYFNSQTQTEK